MGFLGPEQPLLEQLGVARDARTNVKGEHGVFATNVPGVFAAGDMRRARAWSFGPSTKAAAPPANAIDTSWARRASLEARDRSVVEPPPRNRR
jgi:thioredoxin reductase